MNKLFVASIAILTCAIGVFIGAVCLRPCMACPKMHDAQEMHMPPQGEHGPGFKKGHEMGKDFGKDFHKKRFEKMTQELDSLMQVTPEQKTALEVSRKAQDSVFKALHGEKMKAETALREALEAEMIDQAKIDAAKAGLLAVEEKLLNARIDAAKGLAGVLSKEQLAQFKQYHAEKAKKFKEMHKGFGKDRHGPRPEGETLPPKPAE